MGKKDNGRQFCGKPERHPSELVLAVEAIKLRTGGGWERKKEDHRLTPTM